MIGFVVGRARVRWTRVWKQLTESRQFLAEYLSTAENRNNAYVCACAAIPLHHVDSVVRLFSALGACQEL